MHGVALQRVLLLGVSTGDAIIRVVPHGGFSLYGVASQRGLLQGVSLGVPSLGDANTESAPTEGVIERSSLHGVAS